MSYPRIYSLSTVGILKHYVHDYLFHPLRTDFIGPNGVGKSIIADLLQLMFIYDTDLIKFGTDGVKQDERTIYKLPYHTNVAYSFLNIEVAKGKFIIIGIAIHSQVSVRIMPFVITKDSDLSKPIENLILTDKELLLAKDLLSDTNTIPDLKTLAAILFEKRQLYLSYFRNKEEVKRYYQFLYEKQILSINLSSGENLKAFAKVIQSFSKAKTLDLKPGSASRSLKEFLFEESDAELQEDYYTQQHMIERLLREYGSLDKYIKELIQKQQGLEKLKKLDLDCKQENRTLLVARLSHQHHSLRGLLDRENELKQTLDSEKNTLGKLESQKIKLPAIKSLLTAAIVKAEADFDLHVDFEKNTQEAKRLEKEIIALQILSYPTLASSWKKEIDRIDISTRSAGLIQELVSSALTILNEFKEMSAIESARKAQQGLIQQITQGLATELKNLNELIRLIETSSGNSLIQWVIQQNKPLNKEQEALLMHFATLSVTEPQLPENSTRYVDPLQLFENPALNNHSKKAGFWITLGPLKEFIEADMDAPIFENPESFSHSIAQLLNKLKNNKQEVELKLLEIDKINKAKTYNRQLITHDFNLWLIEYSNIEKLKESVACILQLKEKIKLLQAEKKLVDDAIHDILSTMSVRNNMNDSAALRNELRVIKNRQQSRNNRFIKLETTLDLSIGSTKKTVTGVASDLLGITQAILDSQQGFEQLNLLFYATFTANVAQDELDGNHEPIAVIEQRYEELSKQYQLKYHELVNRFEETKDEKHLGIKREVDERTYRFRPLEQALLGTKIIFTDDIATALAEANASRLNMADEIKTSMVKIFDKTLKRYKKYKELVQFINTFFKVRKISDRFYFKVDFLENKTIKIEFVEDLGTRLRNAAKQGELPFDKPVSEFIEEFFKRAAKLTEKLPVEKLLSPKTYFDLAVSLTDENNIEIPGSTGETYSAIALLGIARLSLVQPEMRKGIRFIILEEIGSLDNANFNTFPAIAREYDYQIITMAPQPFRTSLADEWFAHHLIKGKVDKNINYYPSASYFKTKDRNQDLVTYLNLRRNELDRTESLT